LAIVVTLFDFDILKCDLLLKIKKIFSQKISNLTILIAKLYKCKRQVYGWDYE